MEYTKEDLDSCGIYCITCLANGKRYVGASVSIKGRWASHRYRLKYNKRGNPHMQSDYDIYGINGFTFDIVEVCDKSHLDAQEIFWIRELNTLDRRYGYNLFSGGKHPECPDETKQRLSLANSGENSPNFGKVFSKEHRSKISLANKGRVHSKEEINNMSLAQKGKRCGEKHHGFGKARGVCEYLGVSYVSRSGKWTSKTHINGKRKHLGTFTDPILAAKAYDAASFAHYGRTDILNFPEDYIVQSAV